jgi:hypothetical protein
LKEGYVISKSATADDDISKINQFTRRELSLDDVYTFSILLCDNEIDRDNERFSIDALYKLSTLFVGKTGIFDHNMRAENQSARIYDCYVEADESKKTKSGEIYHKLMAKAYMPKTEKNQDLITEIESGIKKEVSVGCSVGNITCSICGEDMRTYKCEHIKGKSYNVQGKEKIAHAVLDCPTDAYEWSFVAVPAQREAGVVKKFNLKDDYKKSADDDFSKLPEDKEKLFITRKDAEKINSLIDDYSKKCDETEEYRSILKKDIFLMLKPQLKENILKEISHLFDKLDTSELITLKNGIEREERMMTDDVKPQLLSSKSKAKSKNSKNQKFII